MTKVRLTPAIAAATALLFGALCAHASVVTSITNGSALPMPSVNYVGSGPQTVAPGVTWTSASSQGVYGYAAGYGFGSNGSWTGSPMAGTNDGNLPMTFTFDDPVSAVGGFLNYAPGHGSHFAIAVYDSSNNLIESYMPVFATGGGPNTGMFYGFQETSATISSFVLSGEYGGLQNLTVGTTSVTPEPGSLTLLGTGMLGLIAVARRRLA